MSIAKKIKNFSTLGWCSKDFSKGVVLIHKLFSMEASSKVKGTLEMFLFDIVLIRIKFFTIFSFQHNLKTR